MSESLKTLAEFQSGPGIPLSDQIILINSPSIFDGFTPFYYPYFRVRPASYVSECWNRKTFYLPFRFSINARLSSNNLYVGFFDRSFDQLDRLQPMIDFVAKNQDRSFKVAIGKGDYTVTDDIAAKFPGNVAEVWGNNTCTNDPRFRYLPMGRDFRSKHLFESLPPRSSKSILCYCNFSTSTHPVRQQLYEQIKHKTFVKFDHMGQFLNYELTREEFFSRLQASKFSICPRGNAYDTFRMWDSMYLGTIPIVVKEASFQDELNDLPILFLNSYEQFGELTEEFLNETYESMCARSYNFDKLTCRYWIKP